MRNPIILGALFGAAFIAGVIYLKRDSVGAPAAAMQPATGTRAGAKPGSPIAGEASNPAVSPESGAAALDPRLAALQVSPDDGSIEFVRGPDGEVIAEIDKDPASPSFRKPQREYLYAGGKVVGLTSYRYFPDHVEINRTAVSYKPDGSIDHYAESTTTRSTKKQQR